MAKKSIKCFATLSCEPGTAHGTFVSADTGKSTGIQFILALPRTKNHEKSIICWQHKPKSIWDVFLIPVLNLAHQTKGLGTVSSSTITSATPHPFARASSLLHYV
jgi:hypothetical protein